MTTSHTSTPSVTPTTTSSDAVPGTGARPAGAATTVKRAVNSELVKLRSLRSHVWLLGVATAFTMVLGPIQSLGQVLAGPDRTVKDSDGALAEALSGVTTSSLLIGVLGVLVVTGEYVPRAIRTTFMLVPRRPYVVVAKAVTVGLATMVTGAVSVAVAVTAASFMFNRVGIDAGWTSPDTPRVSLGMVWYLVGWAVLGQVAGWVTRSKLGGAALLIVVMLVATPLVSLLPGRVGEVFAALMPSSAGGAMVSTSHATALGAPAVGFALWTGYLVVLTAMAAWIVSHRDA
jgi:ABC-2 type transport system permease protein